MVTLFSGGDQKESETESDGERKSPGTDSKVPTSNWPEAIEGERVLNSFEKKRKEEQQRTLEEKD